MPPAGWPEPVGYLAHGPLTVSVWGLPRARAQGNPKGTPLLAKHQEKKKPIVATDGRMIKPSGTQADWHSCTSMSCHGIWAMFCC